MHCKKILEVQEKMKLVLAQVCLIMLYIDILEHIGLVLNYDTVCVTSFLHMVFARSPSKVCLWVHICMGMVG